MNVENVWKAGDSVIYLSIWQGPLPAEILSVYHNGKMTLRVSQRGSVPTYIAKNVKPTSIRKLAAP